MRLLVLGTAAAEGIPAMFCPCRVCAEARRIGGKEMRSRTSYMLGDSIRVDISADAFWQTVRFALDHNQLRHLLITHSHEDHFHPLDMHYRRKGFCQVPADSILHVWGNEHVVNAAHAGPYSLDDLKVEVHAIRPFAPFDPEPGIRVTPIEASHASDEEHALNFIVHTNGTCVLIGNDTGYYAEPTWQFIADSRFDVVFMDSTYGARDSGSHHLGIPWVLRTRDQMLKLGMLNEGCRFIATHFSHNGGLLHHELSARYASEGIEVAYDGMAIELR